MGHSSQHVDAGQAVIDTKYWRDAVLQLSSKGHDAAFDRYRWALRYRQAAKHHHGRNVEQDELLRELAHGWGEYGGPSELTLEEARKAIVDSWNHGETLIAEASANQAGFKSPPTFAQNGSRVPRNLDESNS